MEVIRRRAGEAATVEAEPGGQFASIGKRRAERQRIVIHVEERAVGQVDRDGAVLIDQHVAQRRVEHRGIINGGHRQRKTFGHAEGAVACYDLEVQDTIEIARWLAGKHAIDQRQPCRRRGSAGGLQFVGQRVAVDIGEGVAAHRHRETAIFIGRNIVDPAIDRRSVIDRLNRDDQFAHGLELAVRGDDFQHDGAVEICGGLTRERTVLAAVVQPVWQRAAILAAHLQQHDAAVGIADEAGRQHGFEQGVFGAAQQRDEVDDRRIVLRLDPHMHSCGILAAGAVREFVIEPGIAVEVLGWNDLDLAIAQVGDRQVRGFADRADEDRLEIGIGIIGQQRIFEHDQRRVLTDFERIVARNRRVGHGQNGNRDRAPDRQLFLVLDRVTQRHFTVEVRRCGIAIGAVGLFLRAEQVDEGQRRALGRDIVSHQHGGIDVDISVFEHFEARVADRGGQWHIGIDRNVHKADAGVAVRIGHAIVEACIADISAIAVENGGVSGLHNVTLVAVENFDDLEAVALHVAIIRDQLGEIDDHRLV